MAYRHNTETMKHLIFSLVLLLIQTVWCSESYGQHTAIDIVKSYNTNLRGFISDGDVDYLDNIDRLLRGGDVKCVINNRMAKEFAKEKKWNAMTMHSDTYHNELMNRHDDGQIESVELSDYELLTDYQEPRIKMSDFKYPTIFVAARMNVSGKQHSDNMRDLFFVQGPHIVMIDDMDAQESLSKALEYYSEKNYTDAFRIFRNLAYSSRNSRMAQYYYCVMLIKGQGCKDIPKKVRDLETAWFALSGYKASDTDLSDLATKFSMSIKGSTFDSIWLYRPSYKGRRTTVNNQGKYGIMDQNGKMVLDFREGLCSPLSPDGYATVSADKKKWGLMDSDGHQVIPFDYDNIVPYIVDDKHMAIKDKQLYILSSTGVPLRIIKGDFIEIRAVTEDNLALVFNGNLKQIYDFDGNLIEDCDGNVYLNYTNGDLNLHHYNENKPYRKFSVKW